MAFLMAALLGLHARPILRSSPRHADVMATTLSPGPASGPASVASAATLTVLYDSSCAVCLTNKALLTALDRERSKLEFVDIIEFGEGGFVTPEGGVITKDEAMRHMHVVGPGKQVAKGADAVLTAYQAVGLGWIVWVFRLKIFSWIIHATYAIVSKHRHTISKLVPPFIARRMFGAVNSLNQMSTAAQGLGCDDEEECELPLDDETDA